MSILPKILFICFVFKTVTSDPINRHMKIDGNFDDWRNVPSYIDPEDNLKGTVYDVSPWFPSFKSPDCHDTDTRDTTTTPKHIYNPNVNIVEFKIAHDNTSIYVYYRVADGGVIGKTSVGPSEFNKNNPSEPSAGRFYVIAAVNIDHNDTTGYWLHGGAYHPTAPGFDGNFEIEFYNGSFNQNYYLDHGANNDTQANYLKQENKKNRFVILPSIYPYYTQYIYWNHQPTSDETQRCFDGPYRLPRPYSNRYICYSRDMAPGPFNGSLTYARSEKGNEFEMRAPFEGFLFNHYTGERTLQLGMTINISLSLETSEEYSIPRDWSSDTTATIRYTLSDTVV
ncbi:unnamed protein product [Adineta ricciae]|uniref:Uncharacterized protein n=1 Tax=Adineta ricciae TaxID=249248 RepID=A0A815VQS2_ADIRI|nr:unnamed protein product [Adineta ricciae]CAF1531321.1 unnamed protein product [Adineta ricciae]